MMPDGPIVLWTLICLMRSNRSDMSFAASWKHSSRLRRNDIRAKFWKISREHQKRLKSRLSQNAGQLRVNAILDLLLLMLQIHYLVNSSSKEEWMQDPHDARRDATR